MSADNPDVGLTEGERYYREHGWSGCAGSAWDRLAPATRDGWNAAAAERERADTAEAKIAAAWDEGWSAGDADANEMFKRAAGYIHGPTETPNPYRAAPTPIPGGCQCAQPNDLWGQS